MTQREWQKAEELNQLEMTPPQMSTSECITSNFQRPIEYGECDKMLMIIRNLDQGFPLFQCKSLKYNCGNLMSTVSDS